MLDSTEKSGALWIGSVLVSIALAYRAPFASTQSDLTTTLEPPRVNLSNLNCAWTSWTAKLTDFWTATGCKKGMIRYCECTIGGSNNTGDSWFADPRQCPARLSTLNSEYDAKPATVKPQYFGCYNFRFYWENWSAWATPEDDDRMDECGYNMWELSKRRCIQVGSPLQRIRPKFPANVTMGCFLTNYSDQGRLTPYKRIREAYYTEQDTCYYEWPCRISGGQIAGIVIGVICGLGFLIFIVCCVCGSSSKKSTGNRSKLQEHSENRGAVWESRGETSGQVGMCLPPVMPQNSPQNSPQTMQQQSDNTDSASQIPSFDVNTSNYAGNVCLPPELPSLPAYTDSK